MEKKMMGSSLWVFCLVILVLSTNSVHAIVCPEVMTTLSPCLPYLMAKGTATPTTPGAICCLSVQTVNNMATTPEELRSFCECLQKAANGVNLQRAKQLPQLCHITVRVPIDPKIDCCKISFLPKQRKYTQGVEMFG